MEWVETTGKSLEEAKEAALDQLGVDAQDAEFEVLSEAKPGLFGRMRSEARVRARVRPTRPRPKEERRRRRPAGDRGTTATEAPPAETDDDHADGPSDDGAPAARTARPPRSRGNGAARGTSARPRPEMEGTGMPEDDVSLIEQGEVARTFVAGLLEAMELDGTATAVEMDEDTVEIQVEGDDLGMLIGPKGQTLAALQDLARTVVQRRTGARRGWVVVDVGGYRRKRKEALERFTQQVAEQVVAEGARKVLDPMSAGDRKIVHDTVNTIDGVRTISEGEEPRRRVVLLPED